MVRGLTSRYSDGLDAEDAEALRLFGIDLDDVISRIDRDLTDGEATDPQGPQEVRPRRQEGARAFAARGPPLGDNFIGTEHVLLGILRQGDKVALETLEAFDVTVADVRRAVRGGGPPTG